jgi:hypothetical protein
VIVTQSVLSVLTVGVALLVIDVMRAETRLFVSVSVVALPTSVSVAAGVLVGAGMASEQAVGGARDAPGRGFPGGGSVES